MKITHKTTAIAIGLLISQFLSTGNLHSQTTGHWETAVFKNDTWKYFPGNSEPPSYWHSPAFDDNSWLSATGGFGYGDNDDNTVISIGTPSVYLRIKFTVSDTSLLSYGLLQMDYDDAFVAYLNGQEIARAGITGVSPAYNTYGSSHEATMYQNSGTGLPDDFILDKTILRNTVKPGENTLAIQVHNANATSSDLSSNVFLSFCITGSSSFFRATPPWFKPPDLNAIPSAFSSGNLPIVSINTLNNVPIADEPKVTAYMKIIDHGDSTRNYLSEPGNIYNGKIGIEIRGSSSSGYPQKPYGFETRDSLGNNLNTPLLGMPTENDWVLLANYNDKSYIRNTLAFDLFRKMGHYAPQMRHCEVCINGDYKGIYLLGEKIKRDKNRVNIAKLTPNDLSGDSVTGGYIFKTDYDDGAGSYWTSSFSPLNRPGGVVKFAYYDPKADEMASQQKSYIQSYINTLETVLYSAGFTDPVTGYRAYLDANSFIDYFIISEVTRNTDAYKKSRYFYKNKTNKDKLVYSGPTWDYDWAWKNLNVSCEQVNQTDGSGWAYKVNECKVTPIPPSWEVRLLQDPDFANAVHRRYFSLRNNILGTNYINNYIDSVASRISEAQIRHEQKWKTLGKNVGAPEKGAQPTKFSGDIQKIKDWIALRLSWLDANMVGKTNTSAPETHLQVHIRIFPNPTKDILFIESNFKIQSILVLNSTGNTLLNIHPKSNETDIDISRLKRGIYFVKLTLSNETTTIQKIFKE